MIINEATRKFIDEHELEDVRQLALQGSKIPEVDMPMALQQIAGWQTARRKLPTWAAEKAIVYPPHLNMEQCSSEQTARYKQYLAGKGEKLVDLTGGLGVDFYWMSQGFEHRVYVERNAELCAIATENFRVLNHPCEVCCTESADYLQQMMEVESPDKESGLKDLPLNTIVYMDPARRNEHGGRTFGIEDCTPNVKELLPQLLRKAHRIIVKLSPMLDWRKAVSDLEHVSEVHIVSVDNECKELLLVIDRQHEGEPSLTCVNNEQIFYAVYEEQTPYLRPVNAMFMDRKHGVYQTGPLQGDSEAFLFEPNASIMKAGCFAALEQQYPVSQLSANSHLFVSDHDIEDFPGRRFQISAISSMNKQELRQTLSTIRKANITVRNFPMTAQELRRKLKLQDGGDVYLFATTLSDMQRRLIICRKIG